ncbi:MAG: hypothetical protein Q9169_006790 [Polycauliona sp. 2 TL-2023]
MTPTQSFDEYMDQFVAEWAPDNDPEDIPSVGEIKALSDYLHGRTSAQEAAFAYTRDTISEKTSGNLWSLVYYLAQDLPDTQTCLINLVRAIAALPDEQFANGRNQSWSSRSLVDLWDELRDRWDCNIALYLFS